MAVVARANHLERSKPPHFDRVISLGLLENLRSGTLRRLVDLRNEDVAGLRPLYDLQLRKAGNVSYVTLYCGLTKLLDVHESGGEYWLTAHATHRQAGGFETAWKDRIDGVKLDSIWPKVEIYIGKARAQVGVRHTGKEGAVHALMCSGKATSYRVINREAEPSGLDKSFLDRISQWHWDSISKIPHAEAWWPANRYKAGKSFGASPDILALDDEGRLLVIEAKPPSDLERIAWGPAQVAVYGQIWAHLLRQRDAAKKIKAMLEQRVQLGLSLSSTKELPDRFTKVAPVLAIGGGKASYEAIARACQVQTALSADKASSGKGIIDRPEIWILDSQGEPALRLRS